MIAPLRRPRLWLGAWIAMLAATVVVSLLPMPSVPVHIENFDKIEHLVGYALLAAYASMLFAAPRWPAWLAVFALGIVIEGLQTLVPWRSGGDVADMLANGVGVLAGAAVARTPLRHALAWFERRVLPV